MNLARVYFDGSDKGRIVAVAHDGKMFEQSHEHCHGCGGIAKVMKPIGAAATIIRRCSCDQEN